MTLLHVENLSKEFGGIHAIENLTFAVNPTPGTIHSIIGPNGAGKTTLFNLITGIYPLSAGRVLFDNCDIAGKRPYDLAALGMSRTFQNLQIFFNMSALENVLVGHHLHLSKQILPAALRWPSIVRADREASEQCTQLMRFVMLEKYIGADAVEMPYGALKRLELARALAARPRLLLLDEPAAGLNTIESREIGEVIKRVAETGVTIVLIEHDMKMVMNISDHILVLDYGRKLAEGTPAEVRANPDVVKAYLGAHA
jgi:branched-chain amino acid transport system ATP-binding protein